MKKELKDDLRKPVQFPIMYVRLSGCAIRAVSMTLTQEDKVGMTRAIRGAKISDRDRRGRELPSFVIAANKHLLGPIEMRLGTSQRVKSGLTRSVLVGLDNREWERKSKSNETKQRTLRANKERVINHRVGDIKYAIDIVYL